ncbi:hypothetical protein [Caballeronia zhejiangensis]|uniref:hypothetical protein n=1 Tax=Caballeronia zhejiangensis TaxID=871203 RepID=UPI001FD090FB|nr:hypothetical protein [Caballeronia zhejiangensis]
MYRIDDATAATSLPTPETAGTEGYFTEGNPTAGTPATNVRGSWLNMIQEELCAILAAAGITRSKTTYTQVNSALQKMYGSVVGTARNLAMSVTAASATATLSADLIVVSTTLGAQTYVLPSFSKTINLATTGAGGMDTGAAPVSGFVALYAIYNPATGASALLAKNATSAVQPNVYGGASMPAGYTASALVSVWPTNGSGQFVIGLQCDREVCLANNTVLSTSSAQASLTSFSASAALPPNARTCRGDFTIGSSSASAGANGVVSGSPGEVGRVALGATSATAGATTVVSFPHVAIQTPQTLYYRASVSAGTLNFLVNITAYTF